MFVPPVIAKTEELAEDMRYIGQMAGVNLTSQTGDDIWGERVPLILIVVKNPSSGRTSSSDLTRRYFSSLDEKAVRDLEEVYKVDFEMFNYTMDKYL